MRTANACKSIVTNFNRRVVLQQEIRAPVQERTNTANPGAFEDAHDTAEAEQTQ